MSQVRRFDNLDPIDRAGLDGVTCIEELRAGWQRKLTSQPSRTTRPTRLASRPTRCVEFDPPSRIDLARIAAVAFAGTIAGLKARRDSAVIPNGESRDRLWEDVLGPLARVARQITVVDRYLFLELANAVAGGRGNTGFVAWLFAHLDREARRDCQLTLVGFRARPGEDPVDGQAAAALVAGVISPNAGRLSQVEVLVTQPASFLPHDRHISTSLGVGVSFLDSFDDFSRPTITKAEGVEFAYRWATEAVTKMQDAERRFADDRSAERRTAWAR